MSNPNPQLPGANASILHSESATGATKGSDRIKDFAKFYDTHSPLIYGALQRMKINPDDSAQILTNVFTRIFNPIQPFFPTNAVLVIFLLQITWEETDKYFELGNSIYPNVGMKENVDLFLKRKGFPMSELSGSASNLSGL